MHLKEAFFCVKRLLHPFTMNISPEGEEGMLEKKKKRTFPKKMVLVWNFFFFIKNSAGIEA